MTSVSGLYQEELERAKAKREGKLAAASTELAARRILGVAGWGASGDELRAAAEADEDLEPERYGDVIVRAIEMQADETVRGRRVTPSEASEESVKTQSKFSRDSSITPEKREEIREWLRKRRDNFPDLRPKDALDQVEKVFGVSIKPENFGVTYWRKAAPGENGEASTVRAKPPAPKPAKQPKAAATASPRPVDDRPAEPPRLAPTPSLFRKTMLAMEQAAGGARVILDVEVEHEKAIELVGCIAAVIGPAQADEVPA